MKVTLDIDKLLSDGQINDAEYQKLRELAKSTTSATAFNILVSFGVLAVTGATLALVPQAFVAMLLGLIIGACGFSLLKHDQWKVFSQICIVLGALLLSGGIIWADLGRDRSLYATTAIFAVAGTFAQNSLLIVFATLALATAIGASAGYMFAGYYFGINEPTITILLFSLLTWGFYSLAKQVPSRFATLLGTAAKTSIFLVNMAFWISSLYGDEFPRLNLVIPSTVYAILWAAVLIEAAVWGMKNRSAWILNIAATFGGIHFYTQWFERLGATPASVLCAGILALVFALWLRKINSKMKT